MMRDLTRVEIGELLGVEDHTRTPGGDTVADRKPGHQRLGAFFQREETDRGCALTRLDGLRPSLHDEELAGLSVLRPLDVHRCVGGVDLRVVPLDRDGPPRELEDLVRRERESLPLFLRNGLTPDLLVTDHVIDEAYLFRADLGPNDRTMPELERRLVHVDLIRSDAALNDALAEPPARGHEDDPTMAGVRIERKDDACARQIGTHHLLYSDREGDLPRPPDVAAVERDVATELDQAIAFAEAGTLEDVQDLATDVLSPQEVSA